jgi:hypothetical protein
MTTAFELKVNGVDKTPPGAGVDDAAEWDFTWEERVDGVGTASGTIQDRTNSASYGQERDEIEMLVGGDRVFHGEITGARVDLPPGRPWAKWKIRASDFNTVPDLRLVGVPDGRHFVTIDDEETWETIDLDAHSSETDKQTVQDLFDAYARLPDGSAFDTDEFVKSYISAKVLEDSNHKPLLQWTHTTLSAALGELAAMAGFPIYRWIDPDDKVHWVNFRDFATGSGGSTSIGPNPVPAQLAPAIITDTSPDGATSVGGRDLFIELDATHMPEQCYVVGITDYIFLGQAGVQVPNDVILQGTGFQEHDIRDKSKRQILVDGQAMTQAQKNAIAKANLQFGDRSRVKGSVTVGSLGEAVDGWHCGQLLTIVDARLPAWLNGKSFPIHRVSGSLKAANDFRVYTLEFGDAPIGRFGQKYRSGAQRLPDARLPAKEHKIKFPTQHLRPSTSYVLTSQMVTRSGKSVRKGSVPVRWTLTVKDRTGATVSTGSIVPIDPIPVNPQINTTDRHGRTGARLTTGSLTDLHYHVRAVTAAQGLEL